MESFGKNHTNIIILKMVAQNVMVIYHTQMKHILKKLKKFMVINMIIQQLIILIVKQSLI
jgi:hypothetical protein